MAKPAKPKSKRVLVPRTRNDGTMTEAMFWGWVRSSLRRMSQRWRPIYGVLKDCKRPATPEDHRVWGKRIKFTHQCSVCNQWFPKKEVEVDHIIPCGSLRSVEDVGPFVLRMLCERPGLRVVCTSCHHTITQSAKVAP